MNDAPVWSERTSDEGIREQKNDEICLNYEKRSDNNATRRRNEAAEAAQGAATSSRVREGETSSKEEETSENEMIE